MFSTSLVKMSKAQVIKLQNMRLNNAKSQEPDRLSKPVSASSNLKVGHSPIILLSRYLSTLATRNLFKYTWLLSVETDV